MVCCSMASWILALSCSRMLLNSSSGGCKVCVKMFYSMKKDVPFTYAAEASICQYQSSCLQLPLTTVLRREGGEVPLSLHYISGDIAICPVYTSKMMGVIHIP